MLDDAYRYNFHIFTFFDHNVLLMQTEYKSAKFYPSKDGIGLLHYHIDTFILQECYMPKNHANSNTDYASDTLLYRSFKCV